VIGRRTDFFTSQACTSGRLRVARIKELYGVLRDEQGHRRLFEGYLREFEAEGTA
jgi:hypothetical protein